MQSDDEIIFQRAERKKEAIIQSHGLLLLLLHEYYFSCVVRRTRFNERYPGSKLNPGTLTAPGRFHLVLLRSRPDTVHGFPSRKTQISTPHTRGGFTKPMPSAQHHPCYSGLQVQGTATTPAARVYIITEND